MELRSLEVLLEVVRQRGFTRAGAVLHRSQSAVSKAVRALEDEVGAPLLLRTGRRVELTEAGRVVCARAEALVGAVRALEEEVADLSALRRGRVRVGLPPMVGAAFFPPVLRAFRERHPGVSLELREEGAREIEQAVAARALDVGVTLLPTDAQFEALPLVRDELAAVLHPSHALARARQVRLAELRATPLVLYTRDFVLHARILEACRAQGFAPRIASESGQWDFLAAMVAVNMGAALLPRTMCRGLDRALVRTVRLVEPTIGWNLALIRRRGEHASEAARAFTEVTREVLGSRPDREVLLHLRREGGPRRGGRRRG